MFTEYTDTLEYLRDSGASSLEEVELSEGVDWFSLKSNSSFSFIDQLPLSGAFFALDPRDEIEAVFFGEGLVDGVEPRCDLGALADGLVGSARIQFGPRWSARNRADVLTTHSA